MSGPSGFFDAAHGERTEAARIAGGKDAVARHHDDGECAFDLRERVGDGIDERAGLRVRDELDDDFGVGGGLEVGAVALEARAQIAEVDEVAVVGDGDEALGGVDADGLRVEQRRVAGGGVARVADGHVAGELGEHIVGEDFGDQAHALDVGEMLAVGGGDAGGFLAAMLQSVEARDRLRARRRDGRGWRRRRILRGVCRRTRSIRQLWHPDREQPDRSLKCGTCRFAAVRSPGKTLDVMRRRRRHAVDLVVESGFEGGGPERFRSSASSCGDEGTRSTAISRRSAAGGANMGAERKLCRSRLR